MFGEKELNDAEQESTQGAAKNTLKFDIWRNVD
jgi:hypothetical protein